MLSKKFPLEKNLQILYTVFVKFFGILFELCFLTVLAYAYPLSSSFENEQVVETEEEVLQENEEPVFFTLKDELQYKFDNIHWVNGDKIKTRVLPMPYNLDKVPSEETYTYAQANITGAINPRLEGIGELDYFGVPYDALQYCEKFAVSIKEKRLTLEEVSLARPFLKYFFEVVLREVPNPTSVFYGRPEIFDNKLNVNYRLNFTKTELGLEYLIAKVVAIFENEKWTLYEFEIGKIQYDNIEQN